MRFQLLLALCRLLVRLRWMCAIEPGMVAMYPSWWAFVGAKKRRRCAECPLRDCGWHPRPYSDAEWAEIEAEYIAEWDAVMAKQTEKGER